MPNYTVSIGASVAVVDYDLFTDQVWARSPANRILQGIAVKGSAAAGDSQVELYIDEQRIGDFFNNATGFPNNDDLLPVDNLFIPAGAQLRAIVRDAAATNPLNVMVAVMNARR